MWGQRPYVVSGQFGREKITAMTPKAAAKKYAAKYIHGLRIDLELRTYRNELYVYVAETDQGNVTITVRRAGEGD